MTRYPSSILAKKKNSGKQPATSLFFPIGLEKQVKKSQLPESTSIFLGIQGALGNVALHSEPHQRTLVLSLLTKC